MAVVTLATGNRSNTGGEDGNGSGTTATVIGLVMGTAVLTVLLVALVVVERKRCSNADGEDEDGGNTGVLLNRLTLQEVGVPARVHGQAPTQATAFEAELGPRSASYHDAATPSQGHPWQEDDQAPPLPQKRSQVSLYLLAEVYYCYVHRPAPFLSRTPPV